MFAFLHRRRREKYLAEHPIPDSLWQCVAASPLLRGLGAEEIGLLREQAAWFLHCKAITPVAELELDDEQRLQIALQAVLPVLNLGFDCLDDWHEIVVYPAAFRARDLYHEMLDGHLTLEHEIVEELSGQARPDGPVLLSWLDAEISPWLDGWNVVIHEIAHKLDMQSGEANGCPPLHKGMDYRAWKTAFEAAFADLVRRDESGENCEFDLYAATNPAECFAVCSEYFFELPHQLLAHYPAVYDQLRQFYRQHPAGRIAPVRYRPILPEMREYCERALI